MSSKPALTTALAPEAQRADRLKRMLQDLKEEIPGWDNESSTSTARAVALATAYTFIKQDLEGR